MNYLSLVQQGMLLTRMGDARLSTPITTFTGAANTEYEMIQWIAQSDVDLQLHRDRWLFMRGSADLTLPIGETSLTPSVAQADIRLIIPAEDYGGRRSIGCYKDTREDESRITFLDYGNWYGNSIGRGAATTRNGRPGQCSELNGKIMFDAVADAPYHITFDYLKRPVRMASEGAVSVIPEDYHMAIVFWAITRYYCLTRDKTTELRSKADLELARCLNRMYAAQLPPFTTG